MKRSYFFVSKPLQYINATNIFDESPKVCVFINNMANGLSIFNELKKKSRHWDEILYFDNRMAALKEMIKRDRLIDSLYLDTDYGFRIQYLLSKIRANKFVYEEGVGTYTNQRRTNRLIDQLIGFTNLMLGNQDYIGGYKYTKGVYMYNHAKHKLMMANFSKPRLDFNQPFLTHIKALSEVDVFFPMHVKEQLQCLEKTKIAIYITAWEIDQGALERLKSYADYVKILKPHPHSRSICQYQGIDRVIDGYILVELLLLHLVELCEEVIVIHEGSSFTQYIGGFTNLKLVNINES